MDELFERDELSAAPDPGWPDCFNSGVFVFRPSLRTHSGLLEHALQHGSFDGNQGNDVRRRAGCALNTDYRGLLFPVLRFKELHKGNIGLRVHTRSRFTSISTRSRCSYNLCLLLSGGDQGLLNSFFSSWPAEDISKHLPFVYNLSGSSFYSYLPAFRQ